MYVKSGLAILLCWSSSLAGAQEGTLVNEILVTGRRHSVRPQLAAGATRTQTRIEDIPQAIQVVPRETIDEQQIVRLGDAVANVSNVQLGGTQGNRAELFNIRGFEVSAYAVDGILTNPAQNFTETVRDLTNVAQVEVLKGPASVLYGRGDPGGHDQHRHPPTLAGRDGPSVRSVRHGAMVVASTLSEMPASQPNQAVEGMMKGPNVCLPLPSARASKLNGH